jgi:hypothetical protein
MPKEKAKGLQGYRQSRPEQLGFFELLLPEEKPYSNTIELYDFIPKYHWGKVQRINGQFLNSLVRRFQCRGQNYKVKIQPARIIDKDGTEKEYYPSQREELVEDALRKFVCEGQGIFLDDTAGVTFTLYQLQQELKRRGHTYSISQLKEALFVCAQTKITVSNEDGGAVMVSSLFETLGLQTRDDWKGKGKKAKAYVRFNALVTQSIKSTNFRLLNYAKTMSYKSSLARQLHKRLSHHYTQASLSHPYHIMLSTLIRDFGLTQYAQLRDNLRDVQKALDEMKEKEVLLSYQVEKTIDAERHNKLLDAKLILTPHPRFTGEVMQANKRQASILKLPAAATK